MDELYPILVTILITAFFMISVIIVLRLPRTIDVIRDQKGDLKFKVYSKHTSFLVIDYTKYRKMKIYFKTYTDVEAFISRRINGWKI